MTYRNLEESVQGAGNAVDMLRNSQIGAYVYPVVPSEYSNWRDEQRAWRETCVLFDQSHHMAEVYVEGPDALKMISHLTINSFAKFPVDRAKQFASDAKYDKLHEAVIEVQESVELCQESLAATGKDPRKNTKQFKKIEMRIHNLIRRLRGFAGEVSVEDKPAIEKVANRLDEINDEIVTGIFTKRKKAQQQ